MAKSQVVNPKTATRKPKVLDLDAIADETEDTPEILPRLKFVDGKNIVLREATIVFQEKTPRIIDWTNEDGEDASFPVIEVLNEADGAHYTLVCSAKSIQIGLAKIKRATGTLEGERARIAVEPYKHKKFGNVNGYRVVHLPKNE